MSLHTPENSGPESKERGMTRRTLGKFVAGSLFLGGMATATWMGLHHILHDDRKTAGVRSWWGREQAIFELIDRSGSLQNYVDTVLAERVEEAFIFPDENGAMTSCKCCVDEGIRRVTQHGATMRMSREAGSGILNLDAMGRPDMVGFDPNDRGYLRTVAHRHNTERIGVETWHEECGAARVAYGIAHGISGDDLERISDEEIDAFARTWTLALAQERRHLLTQENRRVEADQLRVQAIRFAEMDRPPHLHIPRVIYYGKGNYNYAFQGLPQGYGVDRDALPAHIAKQNMTVSKAINFGKHGPGNLFTREDPQRIYCIGGHGLDLGMLERECLDAFARDQDYLDGKVAITGFTPRPERIDRRRRERQDV